MERGEGSREGEGGGHRQNDITISRISSGIRQKRTGRGCVILALASGCWRCTPAFNYSLMLCHPLHSLQLALHDLFM